MFSHYFSEEIKAKEDGGERIRLLQDKINEMRKMYSSLKAEVASIDRKKKRLKKKRGVFLFFFTFLSRNQVCSNSSNCFLFCLVFSRKQFRDRQNAFLTEVKMYLTGLWAMGFETYSMNSNI